MALDEARRSRLAELRAKDAEREALLAEQAEERELEAFELVALLEGQGQKRDVDFKVISGPLWGVFGVRKPDGRAVRNWDNATEKEKTNLEWMIGLLKHYIVEPDERTPTRGIQWAQIAGGTSPRPGLCWATATAFVEMMGVETDQRKKG